MAAGDTLAVFDALASRPLDDNHATLDLRGEHPVLDFDAAADRSAVFSGVMPSYYAGGGIAVRLAFSATTAVSGAVAWRAAFERNAIGTGGLDAVEFGPASVVVAPVAPVSGALAIGVVALPAASLSGVAPGEPFRLVIERAGLDVADTAAGDAELLSLEAREA